MRNKANKKRKTLGAMVYTYNSQPFIKAWLDDVTKYCDKVVVLQGDAFPYKVAEGHVSEERDDSFEVIKNYKSDKLYYEDIHNTNDGEDVFEYARNLLLDVDYMIFMMTDMFMTDKDWKYVLQHIQENDFDVYRLRLGKNSIDYYYDFDHGVRDEDETNPFIVKTSIPLGYQARVSGEFEHEIDNIMVHHFRGWKLPARGEHGRKWVNNEEPAWNGMFFWHLERSPFYDGIHSAPKEIQDKFDKKLLWFK